MKIVDTVIIGAGIAGLYSAYMLLKKNPDMNLVILEESDTIGGRANMIPFADIRVPGGAGIGRSKDHLLQALCTDLGVSMCKMTIKSANSEETVKMMKASIKKLRANATDDIHELSFEEYGKRVLGAADYARFSEAVGYTDFQKADAYDTVFSYGLEDALPGWTALSIDWAALVNNLAERIGRHHIRLSCRVLSVSPSWRVFCRDIVFRAKNVVCAVPIPALRKLLADIPEVPKLLQYIEPQPFLRIYARFAKINRAALKERLPVTTIVKGPLQKVIPMYPDKGIYMICYSDNENAVALNPHKKDKEYCTRLLEKALDWPDTEAPLKITNMQAHYWAAGTHYYVPGVSNRHEFLLACQHPAYGLFVVGEAVARQQGWVEGTIASTAVLRHIHAA